MGIHTVMNPLVAFGLIKSKYVKMGDVAYFADFTFTRNFFAIAFQHTMLSLGILIKIFLLCRPDDEQCETKLPTPFVIILIRHD